MSKTTNDTRDAYAFSLGGIRTISSFVAPTAISHVLINKAIDEQLSQASDDQPDTAEEAGTVWGRFWLSRRRRAA